MSKHKYLIFISCGLVLLGLIYFFVDPSVHYMPRCLFYSLTGYMCPGCGSQRALHALLHLDIPSAFAFNPLMVISLPYVLLGVLLSFFDKDKTWVQWVRVNMFGIHAVCLWGLIIILYWILRNIIF